MGLTTQKTIFEQDFRDISSTKQGYLGERAETRDGRIYRYGLAGAVTLAPGKLSVAAAHVANHVDVNVQTSGVAGDTRVKATLGATAATADQYAEGYLVVNDATGEGINYLIGGHAAVDSAGIITVNLVDSLKAAITATTTQVSLIANGYKNVIVNPGALAHRPIGVNNVAITAAFYGWFQTAGACAVLADGVTAKGIEVIASDAVAGAVETRVDATTSNSIGFAPEATVDTEYRQIILTLDK